MSKQWMLEFSRYNEYKSRWEDDRLFFDTKERMISFVNNGNKYLKPKHIRVGAAFKLEQLDSSVFAD